MKDLLEKLLRRESLTLGEVHAVFEGLIGDTAAELKAAVLTALRAKGETVTEILGMAQEMRNHAVRLPDDMAQAVDTCGTGGDGSRSLNLSTLSALTLAAMDVPVVKHGNRSVSSSCGSADLLEGLGFPLDLAPEASCALFRETRFAFLFAPLYHPAMKAVAPIRKALQIRTIFNFLGPLSNPARVHCQVLGVPAQERVRPFAEVLKGLGLKSALVVHGEPALDEISPCGKTRAVYFLDGGPLCEVTWTPSDLGITAFPPDRMAVSGVQEAVSRAKAILSGGAPDSDIQAVAINAAGGLFTQGRVKRIADGVNAARDHIAGGHVKTHFEKILQSARLNRHA